ncbi:MAG: pyridoxal phosphate-dependent aminotransferase [Fidelibacterota bacterium]|nr:MAG: pyridoxal phosphate-dependent aminotransferase [Candidatus Neomarinimicrobiota bacterium]
MIFADRVSRIKSSTTLEMTNQAAELRAAGVEVLSLLAGEPDFPTPEHIIAAARQAMDEGYTRYTPTAGIPQLRNAAATKLSRDNKVETGPDQIIVSNGSKHSMYNACLTLFQQGDEVIIFTPYYVSFPELVHLAHATPIFVDTDPEHGFEPRFNELEAKINSRTKGIIMNSPSNPTGGVWNREAVEQTIQLARRHDLWLLSDESYEALSYDQPFESPAAVVPGYKKILTFQSCSKTYAMTGWRIGYMAGPKEVVAAMTKMQGQSTTCPNSISQMAAIAALIGDQSMVAEHRAAYKRRRGLMVERLSRIPFLSCRNPGGAFYVFLNVSGLFGKTVNSSSHQAGNRQLRTPRDVTEFILDQARVATVSGEGFGDQEHIRLSFAVSDEDIITAVDCIRAAVANVN